MALSVWTPISSPFFITGVPVWAVIADIYSLTFPIGISYSLTLYVSLSCVSVKYKNNINNINNIREKEDGGTF